MQDIKIEVIADSAASAVAAREGGADRIELCDNLAQGGTTPSAGMMQVVRQLLDIKVFVMIRPRGGDFLYSEEEFEVMKKDIEMARETGVDGVVLGILNPDGTIDMDRTGELAKTVRPLEVTFHRAFDMTRDPFQSLEDIISLGIERVLTSGQQPTAWEGKELIKQLNEASGDRITVVAGSGINEDNIKIIMEDTGVREYHFSASKISASKMEFRRELSLGKDSKSEFENPVVDRERVAEICRLVKSSGLR